MIRLHALGRFTYTDPHHEITVAHPGDIIEEQDDRHAEALVRDGRAELALDPAETYPVPPPSEQWPATSQSYRRGPPPWERGGASAPREPVDCSDLPYPAALEKWGDPGLLQWWKEAQRVAAGATDAFAAADVELRDYYGSRRNRHGSAVMFPRIDPKSPAARRDALQEAIRQWNAAVTEAFGRLETDFKERWYGGEFIAWGTRGGEARIVPSTQRAALNLWHNAPLARFVGGIEPNFYEVRFYRVADHPELIEALIAGAVMTAAVSVELHEPSCGEVEPRDTTALRLAAGKWLARFVEEGRHRDRDTTLAQMRAEHPGLGVRGSKTAWESYTRANPDKGLSRRGAKLKRNINN